MDGTLVESESTQEYSFAGKIKYCSGVMGIPITFIDKYNPDQFEILGNSSEMAMEIVLDGKLKRNPQRFYVNGKRLYDRILIKRKENKNASYNVN